MTSVTDAASYTAAVAPGEWVSIFGTGFGATTRTWTSGDFVNGQLPTSLGGVSVSIDGQPALHRICAGPNQINALMPADTTVGQVTVQVNGSARGKVIPGTVMLQRLAPQLFTWAPGSVTYAAAEHANGALIGAGVARFNRPRWVKWLSCTVRASRADVDAGAGFRKRFPPAILAALR